MDVLVTADRCDRCGVQAYVRFTRLASVLDLCGHDTNKYGDALDAQGWSIVIDDRELLTRRAVSTEVK